ELTHTINLDSEIEHVWSKSKALLLQELGFAIHLGIPVVKISLTKKVNMQLERLINEKFVSGFGSSFWVTVPMVHPLQYSPICTDDEKEDSWEWWNDFRTYCNYDKHLGFVLELPDIKHIPLKNEIDRWIGEPIKALIIPTSYFLLNDHGKPVLPRAHQELIQWFLAIDVQYIIKSDSEGDLSVYTKYLHFLGKKLYVSEVNLEFVQGCEDFLQNSLQPLTEHLETNIYEVFEKDQIKYTTYQNAVQKALEDVPKEVAVPVIIVVGAGRGPLVQAALNVSYILHRKIKVYTVEKNSYAHQHIN
ncbi:PRMT5 domain containing protein, partial [Asbolus verrucosus]